MDAKDKNVPDWTRRLSAELRRDKKKTVILAVLGLVAVVMIGRLLIRAGEPAAASAAESLIPAGFNAAADPAAGAAAAARAALDRMDPNGGRQALAGGAHRITQDIFAPKLEFLAIEQEPAERPPAAATQPAEDPEFEAQVIRNKARALVLQCTVVSETPTAIINGRLVRPGEWINGFQVKTVTAKSVTVEANDVEVVLEMAK